MKKIENDFFSALENLSQRIYIFAADSYDFVFVNKAARDHLKISMDDLSKMTPSDIVPTYTNKQIKDLLVPLEDQPTLTLTFDHLSAAGESHAVALQIQRVKLDSSLCYMCVVEDAAQKEIVENRLGAIIKGANLAYWDLDYSTGTLSVNDIWLEMLGLQCSDLVGTTEDVSSRIHPEDFDRVDSAFKQVLAKGERGPLEYRMQRKDGSWIHVRSSGSVVSRDPLTNKPIRVCGIHEDITALTHESTLLRQQAQIISSSQDMIAAISRDYVYLTVNQAYLDRFDKTESELVGKTVAEVFGADFFNNVIKPNGDRALAGETVR